MIRIQLLHEGRVVKQISSRVHESVVLEQVKRFEHAFDEIRVLEGELSEAGKGILHHVAKKVVPAALAAGMALGAHSAHAQNNNFPGLNRSIGQHISDIVSPSYNERMRQRRYEQETERKAWDAQQNELRSARVDQARREGRAMSGHTGTKVYDQARISGDGKYFILYDMDNKITRIPTKDTEFMPGDSQRMSHYISPNGQAYYVRHTHLNESVNESHEDQVTFVIDGERAYQLVMDKYGDQIDWQGDYMTASRTVYNRIEEIVHSAGGDVEEVTGFELPEGIVTPGTIPASGTSSGGRATNTPNIGNATGTTQPEEDDTTNPDGTTNIDIDNQGTMSIGKPDQDIEEAVDGSGLQAILDQFADTYTAFKAGGDIDENPDFFDALYNYYSDSGEMPYDVAQGRQGDPYAWITQKLDDEAGTMPVAEGAEFGSYYSEQLAQKVFDQNPNLSCTGKCEELLDAAWPLAVADLGEQRAGHEFSHSEDFVSDFVSAYSHLQQQQGVVEVYQNDEANLWYIYDQSSQRLKQKMIDNLDEPKARSAGYRDSVDGALRVAGIIRSKFDPKKFVQNQGGKWIQVFPYGKPDVAEDTDAGAEDQAGADQNIIMQIRKVSDYEKPSALKLADGTSVTIAPSTAAKMLAKFDVLKPDSKELMQNTLNTAEGFREMLNYFNEREVHENKIAMEDVNLISKHMQSFNEAETRAKSLIKTVFGKY